jgi:FKBP-type peptidyl-prolyl cis-trans isomerase FklB
MKKIMLMAIAIVAALGVSAQDIDLDAIAQMRKVKADSLSIMLGKVYATQAAMNHSTSEARATLLKAFDEVVNLDKQDEQFREGNTIASEFFKVAADMKGRNGIEMNRNAFAKAFMNRFADTTTVANMNAEVNAINTEAKRLIEELTALHKDSLAALTQASTITLKSDSLSQNMGRFYGMQVRAMSKQKNLSTEQIARLLEGFGNGINVDETNKPLVDGRMLGNDFLGMEQNIKKQLQLQLDKEIFVNTVTSVLNDPKVPTLDDFKTVDSQTQAYFRDTQNFARENSPEALTYRNMGKKYIESIMDKDPGYIQTPSGLVYKMLEPGKGDKFNVNDKIKVMYKGTHVDGKTFDESKEPISFAPNQVVPGFREALLMMRPGAKMIAVLPQELAYGARGAGQDIKPYETLVFEIETLGLDTEAAKPATETKPVVKAEADKKSAKVDVKTVDGGATVATNAKSADQKVPATGKATKKAAKKLTKKSERK